MKILVIGGSYFCGRVFVMEAAREHDITVVNRGTYSMKEFGVKELCGDRQKEDFLRDCSEDFDVLVDFNAYKKGDIKCVLQNLKGKIRQYIFVSTVDVYKRGVGGYKTEDTPFESRVFPGAAGDYIAGKVALEAELVKECEERGIAYTSLRPAFIYGPYNYAPRESMFIQMMVQNSVLPKITDDSGHFQVIYVKDVAIAIKKCLLNEKTFGQGYNLCQDEVMKYDSFLQGLKQAAERVAAEERQSIMEIREIPMTAEEFTAQGLELPFPVREEDTELYSNEKSKRELGMDYLDFQEGIKRTYRAFIGVYSK